MNFSPPSMFYLVLFAEMSVYFSFGLHENGDVLFFGGHSYSHIERLTGLNETHTHFVRLPRFKNCWKDRPVKAAVWTKTMRKHNWIGGRQTNKSSDLLPPCIRTDGQLTVQPALEQCTPNWRGHTESMSDTPDDPWLNEPSLRVYVCYIASDPKHHTHFSSIGCTVTKKEKKEINLRVFCLEELQSVQY